MLVKVAFTMFPGRTCSEALVERLAGLGVHARGGLVHSPVCRMAHISDTEAIRSSCTS